MGLVLMDDRDLRRVGVLAEVLCGSRTTASAADLLGITTRQTRRLLERLRDRGAGGLAHGGRGRPSNHRRPESLRAWVLALLRVHYPSYGPTLASETLLERHGLVVPRETLRGWMHADGLWLTRSQRKNFHQSRIRRERLGELVQIDGADHRWFGPDRSSCTLLVFVDDATSRLMTLLFVRSESTDSYFEALELYLEEHGRPTAFYSERHSIFRVAKADATGGQGLTQFGRALAELNVEMLCANSSQAKGRVERANRTLQDRLVMELALEGLTTMDQANAFLPGFVERFNARFSVPPARPENAHRAVALSRESLRDVLCRREMRYVGRQLSLSWKRRLLILERNALTEGLIGKYVEIFDFVDGRLEIRHQGVSLPHRVFDKDQRVEQGAIVENKRLSEALAWAAEMQATPRPSPRVKTSSEKGDYVRTGVKPGRKPDSPRRKKPS
ncbi:transposase [Acetobacter nitrogenifigens DSM 23921 = NBRC 105050]|uniref:Putative transposase y4bF n=2 Tax=Acetobacter nitrogenifigens TaxID=285268 RepID=A0A511XFL4_9PROT|nr:ISNCY family transposase [Acetobacter nitrogenifigens]GBQ99432.1 transposase [Acetobacter nitrogenifigens DSM 23921 = NBRC 105050]GEN61752.1 putative transposase y4bF [Acetobacter nitrogenifigens DSM 23921 = NBRC 105050]